MKHWHFYTMEFDKNTLDREVDQCAGAISVLIGYHCLVSINAATGCYHIDFITTERNFKKVQARLRWLVGEDVKYEFV